MAVLQSLSLGNKASPSSSLCLISLDLCFSLSPPPLPPSLSPFFYLYIMAIATSPKSTVHGRQGRNPFTESLHEKYVFSCTHDESNM